MSSNQPIESFSWRNFEILSGLTMCQLATEKCPLDLSLMGTEEEIEVLTSEEVFEYERKALSYFNVRNVATFPEKYTQVRPLPSVVDGVSMNQLTHFTFESDRLEIYTHSRCEIVRDNDEIDSLLNEKKRTRINFLWCSGHTEEEAKNQVAKEVKLGFFKTYSDEEGNFLSV